MFIHSYIHNSYVYKNIYTNLQFLDVCARQGIAVPPELRPEPWKLSVPMATACGACATATTVPVGIGCSPYMVGAVCFFN